MTMRIYVEEIKRSGRFVARLNSVHGEIIVTSSRQPLLDAARVLKTRGETGLLEMWGGKKPILRMSAKIEALAELTITERDRDGLAIERWKPPIGLKVPPDGLGA